MSEDEGIIESILRTVNTWIDDRVAALGDFLGDIIRPIAESISETFALIRGTITEIVSDVVDVMTNIFERVTSSIVDLLDGIWDYLVDTFKTITDAIDQVITTSANYLEDLFSTINDGIGVIVDSTAAWLSDLFDSVSSNIGEIIDAVIVGFDELVATVTESISNVIASADRMVSAIAQGVERFIDEVINVAGVTLRELIETVSALPDVLNDLSDAIGESADKNIKAPLELLGADFAESIASLLIGATDADAKQIDSFMGILANPKAFAVNNISELGEFINQSTPIHNVLKTLLFVTLSPLLIMSLMQGINQINAKRLMYDYAETTPHELLTPADYVDAKRRALISDGDFTLNLKRLGYADDSIGILDRLGASPLPVNDLIVIWLRDLISDDKFRDDLIGQGVRPGDVELIKQAAVAIPPISDLIAMAVREVFSPDIAARFGQFEDFPEDVVEPAAKQGLSREWMERYWAAHWALPSPQMGFDMLHRRIINEDDLSKLLRALDVMPFWRDKLIQLSFRPLTRVDVRRMHKLDVLTDDDVREAYLDLGYSPANATMLMDFVIALNAPPPADDEAELQGLSKANILNLYDDGVIDRPAVLGMLAAQGYSPDAAELLVLSVDIDRQRADRKEAIGLITDRFNAGNLSFDQAIDALNGLGLEPVEVERARLKIQRAFEARNKTPSKADLDKFVAAGLIEDSVYVTSMRSIGYADVWIDLYIKLLKG